MTFPYVPPADIPVSHDAPKSGDGYGIDEVIRMLDLHYQCGCPMWSAMAKMKNEMENRNLTFHRYFP